MILIDGSDGISSSFPALKIFLQRLIESLDVGPDKVRIAVAQYSDNIKLEFLLNRYSDKREVIGAIQRLSPVGGSILNTGAALEYLINNVFTVRGGSRVAEGVPQFLILLAADRSRDDIQGPAKTLKSSGTVPFGIGIGNADISELQTISYVPEFAVVVPDTSQLSNLQQLIAQRVTRLTKEDINALIPDVTFPVPLPGEILFLNW